MSYKHFTTEERICIQLYKEQGLSIRSIAKNLYRSPSSISRELSKNCDSRGQYIAPYAQSYSNVRRKHSKWIVKINPTLIKYIKEKVLLTWSPEQITLRLKLDFPNDNSMQISFKNIYTLIYKGDIPDVSKKNLRRKGKKVYYRRPQKRTLIKNPIPISKRASSIDNRTSIGDWEIDTVRGPQSSKPCLATYADRKSRLYVAILMPNAKSETFNKVTNTIFKKYIKNKINSLTADNGAEFARHEQLAKSLKANIYFALPHSPWQRPTNENANGLIREFFPKGHDFSQETQESINRATDLINGRPRKCLQGFSSNETFTKLKFKKIKY